ncbi:hypothetical protein M493_04960 [Geobacillus genomosp. 3]|uniref:Uncharacterized protein n=1 Tax=Geobacillus genomosp. 3 TaxID=1921421 RepID=S5YX73_GEOG3|nr:hypothetical protein M493_04960 [Geobacillus genomosp. 3]
MKKVQKKQMFISIKRLTIFLPGRYVLFPFFDYISFT